jgi:DnaJ-class molecular chaperone
VSAPCTRCAGTGNGQTPASERCSPCDGSGRAHGAEVAYVKIPRGVADGEELPAEMSDGARFVARIVEDARWARDGADIHVTSYMPYELAVLGGTLSVDLPGRTYRVEVEPGTPSGH